MPQGLVALLPLIFSGVGAATALGTSIYQIENQPSQNSSAELLKQQQQQQQQAVAQQFDSQKAKDAKALAGQVGQQIPDLQYLTGGATSPEYLASVAGENAGTGDKNVMQTALNNWLGLGGSTSEGTTSPGATGTTGSNFFPKEAVPAFADFMNTGSGGGSSQGLSGGSA